MIKIQIKFHYSSPHDIQFKNGKKLAMKKSGRILFTRENPKNLLFTIFFLPFSFFDPL